MCCAPERNSCVTASYPLPLCPITATSDGLPLEPPCRAVLSSTVVVAVGMGPGTASEVALALKAGKPVVLLASTDEAKVRCTVDLSLIAWPCWGAAFLAASLCCCC